MSHIPPTIVLRFGHDCHHATQVEVNICGVGGIQESGQRVGQMGGLSVGKGAVQGVMLKFIRLLGGKYGRARRGAPRRG